MTASTRISAVAEGPAPPLLQVSGLCTTFTTHAGPLPVLRDVSFTLARGETLALVGESGSGKSVTAASLLRLVEAAGGRITGGRALFDGVDLLALPPAALRAIRGGRIGMVFQEPLSALNPVQRIGAQIAEAIRLHRPLSRRAAWARAVELLALVQIPAPELRARDYPHQLSGGQRQRAMIAMALACEPELLIADEPTTALDVTTQAQIMALLEDLRRRLGMALLLITHDLGVVAGVADRVVVLYAGRVVEQGPVERIFAAPLHPYTRGLLDAVRLEALPPGSALPEIPGLVPALHDLPAGCAFAPRCPRADARCHATPPPWREGAPHQGAACFHPLPAGTGRHAA
ncbi:ABC transporter ATP-binding protein [Roseomonas sp. GC11]|uniref:ABC transporter ATP-binding protein n=1 Tax=Roseomonas sp. GC11 TaxID=2950546 RepID=UPI00210A6DAA|nr:ABC transporter ATP-binding protein [Roseomonas sp. GC11]MCQ4159052.1 ABC transporter ATP-binding protein [Roseomonas sp. GC11]